MGNSQPIPNPLLDAASHPEAAKQLEPSALAAIANQSTSPGAVTGQAPNVTRIEAEDYTGSFDTTSGNRGRAYRSDNVDIQVTNDAGGGYNVGWIRSSEWLSYNVNLSAGIYDVVFRTAAPNSGGELQLSIGDTVIEQQVARTGRWQRFQNNTVSGLELSSDQQSFRIDMLAGGFNLNYIEFIRTGDAAQPSEVNPNSVPGPLPSGSFNATYGYGMVDAAAAVSYAVGQEIPLRSSSSGNGLELINATDVWNAGYTGQGQVIAVLDTGVDINHIDLANNIWTNPGEVANDNIDNDGNGYVDDIHGYSFIEDNGDVLDEGGHGTHVAGIIAADNNGRGINGVAYNAEIMPVKVMNSQGQGTLSDLVAGIYYAVDNGADIINLSLATTADYSSLRQAINYANNNGAVVVSAAGNSGNNIPDYPARYATNTGLAVGASDNNGNFQGFSNRAGSEALAYVVGPGRQVYSTLPNNRFGRQSGTSMATPHVAGVAALVRSANPDLSPEEVVDLLVGSANPDLVFA
ncbi:MAG: S8 family serine peptidase [Synechococcus sp.]